MLLGSGSKMGTQKWNPGEWNPQLKQAVSWWFNFDPNPLVRPLSQTSTQVCGQVAKTVFDSEAGIHRPTTEISMEMLGCREVVCQLARGGGGAIFWPAASHLECPILRYTKSVYQLKAAD